MISVPQSSRSSDGSIGAGQSNLARSPSRTGRVVVVGMVLVASALGVFAVWFQWRQTRRCLGFFGPEVAASIQSAPMVELWRLSSGGSRITRTSTLDVSRAPGLVHLRRGLVEDVNYDWAVGDPAGPSDRLPSADWDVAIAFRDPGGREPPAAVLAIDLDAPGSLTVVGRPGRVSLGRLRAGLAKWVEATQKSVNFPKKSGY